MRKRPKFKFFWKLEVHQHGKLYLRRWGIFKCAAFRVMIHEIAQPDSDRYPHDHPWPFTTWLLSGGYTENRYLIPPHREAKLSEARILHGLKRRRFGLYRMPATNAFHEITSLDVKPVITFVVTGKRANRGRPDPGWGFLAEDGFRPATNTGSYDPRGDARVDCDGTLGCEACIEFDLKHRRGRRNIRHQADRQAQRVKV